jgi:hypothetical protein
MRLSESTCSLKMSGHPQRTQLPEKYFSCKCSDTRHITFFFLIDVQARVSLFKGASRQFLFKNSNREFHYAKRMFIRFKQNYISLLECCLYLFAQPLKSSGVKYQLRKIKKNSPERSGREADK